MLNEEACRAKFEEWDRTGYTDHTRDLINKDKYYHGTVEGRWLAWQAAWSARTASETPIDIETQNVLHQLNLDRADIATLPEGATVSYNISTIRKASALIKRLSDMKAVADEKELRGIIAKMFDLEFGEQFIDEFTQELFSQLRPYLRTANREPAGDVARKYRDEIKEWLKEAARSAAWNEPEVGIRGDEALARAFDWVADNLPALPAPKPMSEERAVEIMSPAIEHYETDSYEHSERYDMEATGFDNEARYAFRALSQHATITEKPQPPMESE